MPDAGNTEETSAEQGRLAHLRQAFAMSGAMLTALIALVSGALALFFQLRPDLRPDPRSNLGATALVFAVDKDVTLGKFLDRRRSIISDDEYERERREYIRQAGGDDVGDGSSVLTLEGEDVFVRLGVEGFKSRSIGMQASLYDADTGRRVPALSDVPVFEEQLNSPSDHSVVEFWLSVPPVRVNTYFVRVEVFHESDGVLLAVADSERIAAD